MSSSLKAQSRRVFEVATALVPWLVSMYALYWLDYGEVWAPHTAHRDKIAVLILATGMVLSFLVHSYFIKRKQR